MSTFTRSLHPVENIRVIAIEPAPDDVVVHEDDRLGCMRGLAVAMLCNLIVVLTAVAGWELWRWLR